MARIFGFDIGTTSIGWAVIEHEPDRSTGRILGMGVRIFPEARDPDGTPLNQNRRQKRMMRRQLRRRRQRRKTLNQALADAGLLPAYGSDGWTPAMAADPWALRAKGLTEPLSAGELGRALYHLAKRRHFRGRDLEESDAEDGDAKPDEKVAADRRKSFLAELKESARTIGALLAERDPSERKRGVHASREAVADEFDRLWETQAAHHPALNSTLKAHVADLIFAQRPVFWRKSTLGTCRFMPGEELCPKGAWLSQQRRMLEKVNNLELAGGNKRPLDSEERAAILAKLQTQASMSWSAARKALAPIYASRGERGFENRTRFNLEIGGDAKLLGNPLEAKLADIFGDRWESHPHKQAIRDAVHRLLWWSDYGEVGSQRVVILSASERAGRRATAARSFVADFGASKEQAAALGALKFPTGWEPFSTKALEAFLPELEAGVRFGTLDKSPDRAHWRAVTFPDRDQPTGEVLDRLPSPSHRKIDGQDNLTGKEEQRRLAGLRNPTVVRTQNELRKVVNNLLGVFGKPDIIRIELTRDVGLSKREREEKQAAQRKNEKRRGEARRDLEAKGFSEPSRNDIEKWMLWKEGSERCPYTSDPIGFDALFRSGEFDVEHIWPRGRSLDDSQRNKTLCRKDVNIAKGNQTPYEYFLGRPDEWNAVKLRIEGMLAPKGGTGFSRGKVKRFLADAMPDDFAARQLVDTGYAARQAVTLLKRLWPDVGPEAPVTVQSVNGKVTAQLRKLWGLNNILSDDGEKTRADHRHHSIDALVVACADPSVTHRLSTYWQAKDNPSAIKPALVPPWPAIRVDAETSATGIIASHRVRKKISGPLHEDTIRGDTGIDVIDGRQTFRLVVSRKPVEALSRSMLASEEAIIDPEVRKTLRDWIDTHGGDPKKAFKDYPTVKGGAPIKRARIQERRQTKLMANVANGWADAAGNHHVTVWRGPDGKIMSEVVSLLDASRRLARREPIVARDHPRGAFVMSLAPGDTLHIPSGERAGMWTVQGVWAAGPIIIVRSNDATGDSVFRPTAGSLAAMGAKKVSVDPIGRVRPAND